MSRQLKTITEVAERQLCLGCGACAYIQPDDIKMVDDLDKGRRPVVVRGLNGVPPTDEAVQACPGIELERNRSNQDNGAIPELADAWGSVLEVWEGYARDPEVRFAASSGGAATAIALHCLASEDMEGVLHIAARPDVPYLNHTVLSTTRDEMLAATGSRYAPASPCDSLHRVEQADRPCVFIGKPCDVAGAQKARAMRPELNRRLGLTIAMFCAGTPSTRGTLEMIEKMGVEDPAQVRNVRYRGNGWPGVAEVQKETDRETSVTAQLSYDESWGGILEKHRPWRCYICADHVGEFADVAVGDPWYRPISEGEPGRSLVLARTAHGRAVVRRAIEHGALELEPLDWRKLAESQPNLIAARGAVWGRMQGARLTGMKVPRYRRMSTLAVWWRELSFRLKVRSLLSPVKRRLRRQLRRRVVIHADD